MHISIPETEECVETKGDRAAQPLKYLMYNIHINGTYHCSARYSQLLVLHQKLKREFGAGCLGAFPGKSFFYMGPDQAKLRRVELQQYLQVAAQQNRIVMGETFQNFLLNAQKEVQSDPEEPAQLEVFLVNGKSVKVDIMSTDQTEDVLEALCANHINLPAELTYYFGLFLVDDVAGKLVVRQLQDFESPYISLMRAEPHQKIQLRKAYWNSRLDDILIKDPIALNLLYIQTISDIRNEVIKPRDDAAGQLASFRDRKDRTGFLQLAAKQPGYGFASFGECTCNYPEGGTPAVVLLGKSRLILELRDGKHHVFLVHRMRCWRTYTVEDGVELEFEYHFTPEDDPDKQGQMVAVHILSPQTIHLAMCLQAMVEEMVRLRHQRPIKKPKDRAGRKKPKRQTTGAATDLTFLAAEPSSKNNSGSVTPTEGSEPPSPTRITVRLSGLLANVKDEDDEPGSPEMSVRDFGTSFSQMNKAQGDDTDDDDDDPANAFASIAGL